MDAKPWLWRRKSAEKTIIAANKERVLVKGDFEVRNESGHDRVVKNLNEKLASVLLDSNDKSTSKEEAATHDTMSDQRNEAEADSLRKELDDAVKQGAAANERLASMDAELKQCMQELHILRQEQEQKMQNVFMKASSEFGKEQKQLEEKLMETSKRLSNLAIENSNLARALIVKEELAEELHNRMAQTISEFNALMARLDSTEKESAFLKYEFHMLEKELEIRNEELEYHRHSADELRRQQMESVKTIAKLEAECQKLRRLMRKKLPGPAAVRRIKGEVELLQGCKIEARRKPNPSKALIVSKAERKKSPEVSVKNVNFLIEQLRTMEEENKILLDILSKKNNELESSRAMFSRAASRLSHIDSRLSDITGGQGSLELVRSSPISNELYPVAGSDVDSIDGVSSSGSWATALISGLENIKEGKVKMPLKSKPSGVSEMSLLDDFVEMEKLALVSAGTTGGMNKRSSSCKELVLVLKDYSGDSTNCNARDKPFDWIQEVLNAIFKQQRISRRSLAELLQDIKIVLGCVDRTDASGMDTAGISKCTRNSNFGNGITAASPINTSAKETSVQGCPIPSTLSKHICKIMEMVEQILLKSTVSENPTENGLENISPTDYFVHIFQWRGSELGSVLKRFTQTCNGLLNRKVGIENFVEDLSSALEWTICNHGTSKDDSSARDIIKNQFPLNQSQRGVEGAIAVESPVEVQNVSDVAVQEENNRLKLENGKTDYLDKGIEAMPQSEANKNEAPVRRLKESEQNNESLQSELKTLRESKAIIENQFENQKLISEDLDTQLTVTKAKLNEVLLRLSSLEVELEDRSNCCEDLEATCLELQLQLESTTKKENEYYTRNEDGKQSENGWEITAASKKLAECQETILNLGKQLKTLASPRQAAIFDKVFKANISTTESTNNKSFIRRFSLRDQMVAEDNAKAIILRSPINQTDSSGSSPNASICATEADPRSMHKVGSNSVGSLAIVPSKKGLGFLRRLLMRRKKSSSKKSR